MSIITEDFSHLGTGELWMRRRGQAVPMRPIGNASELSFAIEQTTISQQEFRSPGGGARNEINRITSVAASINVYDLSPENIAMVLYGDSSTVAATDTEDAATIKKETFIAYKGGLIPLDFMDPSAVVVTKDPDGTPVVATVKDDYEVRVGGIFIVDDGGIANGDTIEVAYHHGAQYVVEAMVNSGYEFEASFRGYNEARSKHFSLDMWRLRFPPTENLGWVGDEFAQLQTSPKLLSDAARPAGKSQFFRVTVEA